MTLMSMQILTNMADQDDAKSPRKFGGSII